MSKKQRRAVIVGFDYYARYLADLMNRHAHDWRAQAFESNRIGTLRALASLRGADALISFGGPGPSTALTEAAEAWGVPVVVIWAGTDVLKVTADPFKLAAQKYHHFNNISDGAWLVDELRVLGVDAKYLPVTAVELKGGVAPLPARFRVLTYLPQPRREFYGEQRVYRLARAMPDVEFVVIGAGGRNRIAPPNVTFRGYIPDVAPEIDASTVLLRLPEHDGKSMLVLETLARGRHVIWTHEFPGVHAVDNPDRALRVLYKLYESHQRGKLALNDMGRSFVQSTFTRDKICAAFESYLDRVAPAGTQSRSGKPYRVAISGLDLFCAEVAKQVEARPRAWKVSIIRSGSRMDVIMGLFTLLRSHVWYSIGNPVLDRWLHLFAQLIRKPRVVHWVGSDLENLRNSPALVRRLQAPEISHLTEIWWTSAELAEIGLQSTIAPLPLRHRSGGVKPLPDIFTIMLYLPNTRTDFYGRKDLEAMLRELAQERIRLIIAGGGSLLTPAGMEVINLGWRDDLRDAYAQSTVLGRLTPRDGLSLMVLEALSFGRYVMWSKPFPFVTQTRNRQELIEGVKALLERHRNGSLLAQYTAAEMVARNYSDERAIDRICDSWETARTHRSRAMPGVSLTMRVQD